MQRTVFFIAYTKKSTMLSLRVIIIRSVRVVCKYYITGTSSAKKNTGQCFSIELQFTCITSDKSEKNRKKTA